MNYFDLHCDTPYECFTKGRNFNRNNLAVSGEKGRIFEKWRQVFAVWIRDDAENPYELYCRIITDFKTKLKERPDNLTPYFSVEGGAVVEEKTERLYKLKEDGIKILTLVWNGENRIAGGSKSEKGLTDFGKSVIKELNALKICCDLSHCNDKSFFKAVEIANYPIATHSNCRSVCNVPRNLTDEQLKLIAEKNGIIGICFYPLFLGGDIYCKIYENVCHMLESGLENNICIGSDFDGAKMDERLSDISKIPFLYGKLAEKGLNKDLLDKFFYKNAENYFETFDKKGQVL